MGKRLTKPAAPRELGDEDIAIYLSQFMGTKHMVTEATARMNTIKQTLMDYIADNGIEDGDGHQWVTVDGHGSIKRERRVSSSLDENAAKAWLRKRGRLAECLKRVVVTRFDEDQFLAVLYEEDVSDAERKRLYDETITYAFVPGKGTPS